MCRSLAFPSYKGSVWHDTDKRPSSCWLSFLRAAEASHSPGDLPGPLEHRVQNSDLDLKWSRGRVTVGRSCPYAGCQCAEGRQNLCLSWWGWPHTGLMRLSQCQGCGEGRALLPDASWKGVEWAMESGHYVLSHFIPYTIMVVSKGSFLQDPAWPRR